MINHQFLQMRGNIIVFALTAIAAMSITAALLTTLSVFEIRKSVNVERAILARYKAETGIENSLFILNRAFLAGKSIDGPGGIKDMLGFADTAKSSVGEMMECEDEANLDDECDALTVTFGVASIRVDLEANKLFTLNIFDPNDKNQPPYNPYRVDKVVISGLQSATDQVEVTFIAWENDATSIRILDPIKRIIDDGSNVGDPLDGSPANGVSVLAFPCGAPPEDLCEMTAGSPPVPPHTMGQIRLRLLSPAKLSGITVALYNGIDVDCAVGAGFDECTPGFVEIVSTGFDGANKQALKVITRLPEEDQPTSDIWDYVIFSNQSLSK